VRRIFGRILLLLLVSSLCSIDLAMISQVCFKESELESKLKLIKHFQVWILVMPYSSDVINSNET
jgi:hypothetical protein